MHRFTTLLPIAGLLVLLSLLINASALGGHWRWDDAAALLHLHQHSLAEVFTNPEAWQAFSRTNLMPWMLLSYEVDLTLFGLNPALFYLHHLLALAAAAFALYLSLDLWTRRHFALMGAVLFLVGTPSLLVAQQLMTRHYIEGLVFCLLSLVCFVQYLRGGRIFLLVLSAIAYLCAVTAKEIYVPLLILLAVLPEATPGRRLRALIPFIVIAAGYTLWRGWMLGTLLGGYTNREVLLDAGFLPEVIASFAIFPRLLFGAAWPIALILYVGLLALYARRRRSFLGLMLVSALLILLPLIPLVRSPGILSADRYLFLLWAGLCFCLAWCGDRLFTHFQKSGPRSAILLGGVLASMGVLAMWHSLFVREELLGVAREYDTQSRFLWENGSDKAFEPSPALLRSYWFVPQSIDFKKSILGAAAPQAIPDDRYLNEGITQLFRYDSVCDCMTDVSAGIAQRRADYASTLREDATLQVRFEYRNGLFRWALGPYEGGYSVVSDVLGVIPLPPSGELGATLQDNAPLYIRYDSPEGWVTYSGEFRVVHNAPEVNWSREP